jgi:hypothetical protein
MPTHSMAVNKRNIRSTEPVEMEEEKQLQSFDGQQEEDSRKSAKHLNGRGRGSRNSRRSAKAQHSRRSLVESELTDALYGHDLLCDWLSILDEAEQDSKLVDGRCLLRFGHSERNTDK